MRPLDNCPVCNVPVKWALHDGLNSYDCGKGLKQCPIHFSERIHFPEGSPTFDLINGVLYYYSFEIGGHHIVHEFYTKIKSTPRLIINPEYHLGYPTAVYNSIVIHISDIDWSDLSRLERKIKTWILFS